MERLVIIGGGMAAGRLVEELERHGRGRYAITVIAAEKRGIYNRILLSSLLAGDKTEDEVMTHTPEWFAARGIRYRMGAPVTQIDRAQRCVHTQDGEAIAYDHLVLATGSDAAMLPLPGCGLPGVVTFRDLADVERMVAGCSPGRPAIVIGGGLLGLEAASGLARRGMCVTVVHVMPHLMERQLDGEAGALLTAELARRGIVVHLAARSEAIVGDSKVEGLRLAGGETLPADLIVMAVGTRPNAALARAAGLDVNRGVVVDDVLMTSDPAISALGECIEHRGQIFGLVGPIWEQAAILARRLGGDNEAAYVGTVLGTALKVSGVEVYSTGDHLGAEGADSIILRDPAAGYYRKLVLRDGRLAGAVLYGDSSDSAWYFDLICSGRPVTAHRDHLVFGQRFASAEAA